MNKKTENFLLNLVKSNYEYIAEKFNETRKKPMKEMVYKITETLNIKKGDRVLDLGCGNGCFFEVLPEGVDYLGIDNSKNLISYGRKKYGEIFLEKNILEVDSTDLENFKYIFSWAVFHHIPGQNLRLKFLESIYNNINNGSYFIFSVWKLRKKRFFLFSFFGIYLKYALKGFFLDFGDLIFSWKGSSGKSLRYYHAFSEKSLKKLVKKTKFKLIDFLEDEFNYYLVLKK